MLQWLVISALAASAVLALEASPTVQTEQGPIFGYLDPEGSYSFKGVPFAAPPLGNLRFAAPVDHASWTAPRNATTFGPGCYSHCNGKFAQLMCAATVSEDCLYLNVYTPSLDPTANLPVIFFIHGGMFSWGSGGIPLYEGNLWAKEHNLVIVTINYRLNIFGALYTGVDGSNGNFNILDQRKALEWVNKNIKNFGGDPTRVVLSGQSAGATSTGVHLTSPGSWPYFQRAAIISDPYGLIPVSQKMAQELGELVEIEIGCSSGDKAANLACLRNKTTEEIFQMAHVDFLPTPNQILALFMQWTPVVDGVVVPMQPLEAMALGKSNPVPLYIGTVANETIPFIFGVNFNTSVFIMDVALDYVFGIGKGTAVAEMYGPVPADQQDDTRPFFSAIFTDYSFYCPSRYAAMQQAKVNNNQTYMYFFDEHPSWALWYSGGNKEDPCVHWICHAFDLPTIFNTYFKMPKDFPRPTAGEAAMGNFTQTAWTEFAYTGKISNWPAFTQSNQVAKNISIPVDDTKWLVGYRQKYCDYFDTIGYQRW